MMSNKKVLGIAGLAAVMMIGGTLAYFSQEMSIENPFDTGKYDSVIVEDFKPSDGDNWEPGAKVDKEVKVENTGDYDILVRVKFDEKWVNKDDSSWTKTNTGTDVTTIEQANVADGLIAADKSVVEKTLDARNWVYNDADKYWYYTNNLESGENTGAFLKDVTLLEDVDMGAYEVINYYTKSESIPEKTEIGQTSSDAETKWVQYTREMPESAKHSMAVTKLKEDARGYANAEYTLTITAETVQATDAAMKNSWNLTEKPSGCDAWNLTQDK